MIETATFTTSRVVGVAAPISRASDTLRIQQAGNINLRTGRVEVTFAPQYDGVPPVNTALFDTRDPLTLRSGYVVRHRQDGKFELNAVDAAGAITTAITASSVPLTAGVPVTITSKWSPDSLVVLNGSIVLAQHAGVYSQPIVQSQQIAIGQKIDQTEPLYGELHKFVSYGMA